MQGLSNTSKVTSLRTLYMTSFSHENIIHKPFDPTNVNILQGSYKYLTEHKINRYTETEPYLPSNWVFPILLQIWNNIPGNRRRFVHSTCTSCGLLQTFFKPFKPSIFTILYCSTAKLINTMLLFWSKENISNQI